MVVCYIVMIILGAVLIKFAIKKSVIIMVAGALLAAGGLFLVVCTIILASAVRNSEPNPKFDNDGEFNYGEVYEVTDDGDGSESDGETVGSDWRTWRSYSADYAIGNGSSICLSPFDDGSGYAVYDSSDGSRVGSVILDAGQKVTSDTGIKCEDIDGDGLNEIGIALSEDDIAWYHYTDNVWKEGEGGGCLARFLPEK